LSNPPEKKHPWAKFKAKPSAPRLPTERALPQARPLPGKTGAEGAPVVATPPVERKAAVEPVVQVRPVRETPAVRVSEPAAVKAGGAAGKKAEATRPTPTADVKAEARPRTAAAVQTAPPAKVLAGKGASDKAEAAAPAPKPEISAGLASVLSELEKVDLDPAVVKRVGRERDASPRQRRWMWDGLKDSVRKYRRTASRLREWWRVGRTGTWGGVPLALGVMNGLVAMSRQPSSKEQTPARHAATNSPTL